MKNTHLAVGIASSIAVGAILGILFAPDKGCNTRKKLLRRVMDLETLLKTVYTIWLHQSKINTMNLVQK